MLSFFKKKDEDLTNNGKKKFPVFDESLHMIDPVDIPLGLPTFKEYSEYTLHECEILLVETEKLKKGYLSKYERDYLSDFEKSLESIIYVKSHPEELGNIEFFNI